MKPTFALKDGKPVHISDIPDEKRGLKCGCVCSACGHPLQARKGNTNAHHFAHDKGSECSAETVIHQTAKTIIMEAGEIHVPATRYNYKNIVDYYLPDQVIPLSNIHEEKDIGNIQPDIISYYKGKPLLIEIYVTHKVDDDKIQKIKDKGISAIEIDLSGIGYETDIDALRQLVLYDSTNRYWINDEDFNALHNRFLNLLEHKPIFSCTWSGMEKFLVYEYSESSTFSEMLTEEYEYREKVMSFVFDCPIDKQSIEGQSYALFTNCMNCKFKYGKNFPNGCVVCAGNIETWQLHN